MQITVNIDVNRPAHVQVRAEASGRCFVEIVPSASESVSEAGAALTTRELLDAKNRPRASLLSGTFSRPRDD